ncbi:hypothetical protein [Amycolatopsis keratiniphila]|uniref:Uncharacterized protein n=1 Tax=Amycolatopsis keratiniphila subsp. keratiniphila TaxID=227715 RepID=A0A1W2M307_9PSEU|nr:hypothetical protein [Amycolatopsis keratiniphila]OLZ58482.1 hypothetical protein BS330_11575 [Amycolatopsis keratiniphila subsp. nogabecina]ONF74422.1 hypothetical protein AVR91_0203845 [Amycolatopsis keratiniphila subsp. keratiniphila]SDU00777.1 hypothetical protein SAMN04489733_0329 [Amycolatopsis keratiniphila]
MNRLVAAVLSAASVGALLIVPSPPALAAAGEVVVFSTEFQRLDNYRNPEGCNKLPVAAHVLLNLSSSEVVVHADPLCLTPGMVVGQGFGSHVTPGSGSFSVNR